MKEFDLNIIGFRYDEGSCVGDIAKVVMEFSDGTEFSICLMSDKFFYSEFGCDERSICGVADYSKSYTTYLIECGNYSELFEFMLGLHVEMYVKSKAPLLMEERPSYIRSNIYKCIYDSEVVLYSAIESYYRFAFNHLSSTGMNLDSFTSKVMSSIPSMTKFDINSCVVSTSVSLVRTFSHDLEVCGDLYMLNSFIELNLEVSNNMFRLKAISVDRELCSDVFIFDSNYNEWLVITALFNLLRKLDFGLEGDGLLYDKDVIDLDNMTSGNNAYDYDSVVSFVNSCLLIIHNAEYKFD